MQTIRLEIEDNEYSNVLKVLEKLMVRIINETDDEDEDEELAALIETRKNQIEIMVEWHEL